MKNIVIFGSGSGSNAQNIAEYFRNSQINVSMFLTNNPNAYMIERAKNLSLPCVVFSKEEFSKTSVIVDLLKQHNTDLVVLAGFLWLVPEMLIQAFPDKIINIHPALLPKYGGKGMYGDRVHEQVINNKETESGITVHYVNAKYDEGNIVFQGKCAVEPFDTAETLAKKIHKLEYEYYPKVIEKMLLG